MTRLPKLLLIRVLLTLSAAAGIQAKCSNKIDSIYDQYRFVKCTYKMEHYDYKLECEELDTQATCDHTTLEEIHQFVTKHSTKLRLYVSDSTLEDDGKPREWTNVTDGYMENINFTKLDERLFKGFNDLISLEITKSKIPNLPANTFKSLEKLEKLNISGNSITALDKDAFTGLNITYLNLRENQITSLPNEIFSNLPKVQEIDLSFNKLTKVEADFPKFLVQLKLNDNQIKGDFNFSIAPALNLNLDLSNNKIENLVNFKESGATNIKLSKNQIKTLPTCGQLLFNLDISLNALTKITPFAESNLRILNASNNNIETLEANAFAGAENLNELYLNHNKLGNLTHGCFNHLDSLKKLDLSHNEITKFTFGLMDPLKKLEVLDISYNNHEIDLHTMLNLYRLTSLKLAGNKVDTFDPQVLVDHFTNLETLSIDDTVWNCKELSQAVAIIEKKSSQHVVIEQGDSQNYSNVRGIKCTDDPTSKSISLVLNPDQLHPRTMDELASSFLTVEQHNHRKLAEILQEMHKIKEANNENLSPVIKGMTQISENLEHVHVTMEHHSVLLKESAPTSTVGTFVVFITIVLSLILALMVYNVFYTRGKAGCSGDQINLV